MAQVTDKLRRFPVVAILGARQVGKTTLTRQIPHDTSKPIHRFDLENPEDLVRLSDPMLALKHLTGLVILDEIQRTRDVFPVLRVLADREPTPCRFLILGSASPNLLKQSSETLAGRIIYHFLGGIHLREMGDVERLWRRGGFPRSILCETEQQSVEWRKAFISTFLERDIPQLGFSIDSTALRRFWTMIAHYHGQVWNSSEFARSFGVSDTTVKRYLDILTSALIIRQLQPWYENVKKRQVKAPKVYIADSGLLHGLLNLTEQVELESHPKLGASWEGFAIDQIVRHVGAGWEECFFWSTHSGAELDLLIVRGQTRLGFEIKRTAAPRVTPSMRSALDTLRLSSLIVIHAGEHTFPLSDQIQAVPLSRLTTDVEPLE